MTASSKQRPWTKRAPGWIAVIALIATAAGMILAAVNLNTRIDERSAAIDEREDIQGFVRDFARVQRELLRLMQIVEAKLEHTHGNNFATQRDIVESRFFILDSARNQSRMPPELQEFYAEARLRWDDAQPLLAEFEQDPQAHANQLDETLTGIEFLLNQYDNLYIARNTLAVSAAERTEDALSRAIIIAVVLVVMFIIAVAVNFFRSRMRITHAQRERARADEANQLKSQFLANMSHELRTPLNSVINFTDFVAQEIYGPVTPEQVDALSKSRKSAHDLLGLINDILDISKIEAGMMELFIEEVNLNEVLSEVIDTGKALIIGGRVSIESDVQPNLPIIKGDRLRVQQIMLNLMSNAVRYTEKGSITVSAHQHNSEVQMSVKDTGQGIPAEEQDNIFEQFRQVNWNIRKRAKTERGTGLGLAITRHFTEMHGGRVWVESQPGLGSTFFVTLPLVAPEKKEPA